MCACMSAQRTTVHKIVPLSPSLTFSISWSQVGFPEADVQREFEVQDVSQESTPVKGRGRRQTWAGRS